MVFSGAVASPPGLTDKQENFCQAYIRHFSVLKAFAEAGYSPDNGNAYRTFKNPNIQSRIKELLNQRWADNELAVLTILEAFRRIGESCENDGNMANALRAWENMAKYFGMFTEHLKISQTVKHQSEEDLDHNIDRLLRVIGRNSSDEGEDFDTMGNA